MNNLNSPSADIEWVDEVYQLLIEIARCSLSEIPKLPDNISQKALPLIQKIQSIQDTFDTSNHLNWHHREREWVDRVGQLLIEITRVSLSEQPKLPENLAGRALELAEKAQVIRETAEEDTPAPLESERSSNNALLPPDSLLSLLQESLSVYRAKSRNPGASEWQHLFSLVEEVQAVYNRVRP